MNRYLTGVFAATALACTTAIAQQPATPPAGQSPTDQPQSCATEIKKVDAEVIKIAKTDAPRADQARKLRAEAVKFDSDGKSKECLDKVGQAKDLLSVK